MPRIGEIMVVVTPFRAIEHYICQSVVCTTSGTKADTLSLLLSLGGLTFLRFRYRNVILSQLYIYIYIYIYGWVCVSKYIVFVDLFAMDSHILSPISTEIVTYSWHMWRKVRARKLDGSSPFEVSTLRLKRLVSPIAVASRIEQSRSEKEVRKSHDLRWLFVLFLQHS